MDWTDIKDIVLALTGVSSATIAWKNLATWQRQLQGKEGLDAARTLLKAVYIYRDAIQVFRCPSISRGESEVAVRAAKRTLGESVEIDEQRAVYSMRWNSVREAGIEVELAKHEAGLILGKQGVEAVIIPLLGFGHHLLKSLNLYLDSPPLKDDDHNGQTQYLRAMLDITETEGDNLSIEFNNAIGRVEQFLEPFLSIVRPGSTSMHRFRFWQRKH